METDISTALATLQIDPDNTQALGAWKRIRPANGSGVDPDALGRALTDARRWHRERGDFELCVQLIDLELPWLTDPARRANLLHEKGRLLADELLSEEAAQAALAEAAQAELSLKLCNQEEALGHFRKALEANPSEAKALRPVVAALNERKDWPELAKVLEAASRSRRAESDVLVLTQLATLQWKKLNEPAQAELNFRKLRRLDPANRAMVEFYREYHGKRDDLPQLLAVLAGAQKADPDPERRIALGIEMAKAAESRPQNAEKVIDIWKGLLRLRPHLPEAVEALRRLYERGQKWNALLDLLKDDLEALGDDASVKDERIKRYLEIADIYRDRLNLEVMVVNTYLNVLQLDPDHPVALGALAARYEAQGRWSDLIQILTRQADRAERNNDRGQALAIHRKIAALWMEKLAKHQNAVASREKILEADPTDAEARARLRDIYVRGRSWRALVDLPRREAPLLPPADRRERLYEKLGAGEAAIEVFKRVQELQPQNVRATRALREIYAQAGDFAALERLYADQGNYEDLCETLVVLADRLLVA